MLAAFLLGGHHGYRIEFPALWTAMHPELALAAWARCGSTGRCSSRGTPRRGLLAQQRGVGVYADTTSSPEAEGDAELAGVERHEAHRRRHPLGRREVDGARQAHGLLAGEPGGAVEAALVDGHDVDVIPRQAHGIFEVEAQHRLVGESVDGREGLGEGERRRTPEVVVVEGGEHDGALGCRRRRAPAALRCRGRPSSRSSTRARSIRTPDHTGTGAGGRHGVVRRGGRTAPLARSRSRSGAWSSSGPSWACGRPLTVTTVRSPAAARRTAAAGARTGERACASERSLWTRVYTSRLARRPQAGRRWRP